MTNDKIGFRRSLHSSKARIALFEDERDDARYTEWLNRKMARNLSDSRPSECSDGLCYACPFFPLPSASSPARSSFSRASSFSEQV